MFEAAKALALAASTGPQYPASPEIGDGDSESMQRERSGKEGVCYSDLMGYRQSGSAVISAAKMLVHSWNGC